jgi:unsaturated rhamnogalacturonyl hydrolase
VVGSDRRRLMKVNYLFQSLMADRGFQGVLDHMVTIDEEGQIDLHGICSGAGLGGTPYRDGSFEYYIREPVTANDLHGVGAFLLAAIEMDLVTARQYNK